MYDSIWCTRKHTTGLPKDGATEYRNNKTGKHDLGNLGDDGYYVGRTNAGQVMTKKRRETGTHCNTVGRNMGTLEGRKTGKH